MSLIATARALDDQRFIWRVKAATMATAASKINDPDGFGQRYAEYVLDHPMEDNLTIAALVACNQSISSLVEVDVHSSVNTEAIPDSDILYVVSDIWNTVAMRWDETTNPAPTV